MDAEQEPGRYLNARLCARHQVANTPGLSKVEGLARQRPGEAMGADAPHIPVKGDERDPVSGRAVKLDPVPNQAGGLATIGDLDVQRIEFRPGQQLDVGEGLIEPAAQRSGDYYLPGAEFGRVQERQFQVGLVLVGRVGEELGPIGLQPGALVDIQRVQVADDQVRGTAAGQRVARPAVGRDDPVV